MIPILYLALFKALRGLGKLLKEEEKEAELDFVIEQLNKQKQEL